MKNICTMLAALCVLATSCKKENSTQKSPSQNDSTAFSVNFNLGDFNVQSGGLQTTGLKSVNALKDQISYLHYAVYRGSPSDERYAYQVRKQLMQTANDANFGAITDTLYSKRYGIYFVGAKNAGIIYPSEIHGTAGYYITHPIYDPQTPTLSKELYYAKIDTTVTSSIKKSVTLKRMVSMFTVRINDIMPANADKVVITYRDYPPGFDLAIGTGRIRFREDLYDDLAVTYQVTASDRGKENFSASTVIWPYRYLGINISCYDKNGNTIVSKDVTPNYEDSYFNVAINTHYICEGSLFAQSASFKVSVDERWNAPIKVPFNISYLKHKK
ncbi:hypothetical protein IM792_10850 [Mucilaginibacter sp. JRF]|uniref:hypothetical protein n=1 Tax=Mucilaginibacter sp. JRF TaxID=2780088 RepID=UPI00187E7356|nr:hypothetical protein [Mucilaginibacter sp. JRF]MBE9584947.1 hypothetical protein [Mucilaginibacter sp. JRF]